MELQYAKNEDGERVVINPPVIPEYEQAIAAAQAAGDQSEVDRLSAKYAAARDEQVKEIEDWQRSEEQSKLPPPSAPVQDPDNSQDHQPATSAPDDAPAEAPDGGGSLPAREELSDNEIDRLATVLAGKLNQTPEGS